MPSDLPLPSLGLCNLRGTRVLLQRTPVTDAFFCSRVHRFLRSEHALLADPNGAPAGAAASRTRTVAPRRGSPLGGSDAFCDRR